MEAKAREGSSGTRSSPAAVPRGSSRVAPFGRRSHVWLRACCGAALFVASGRADAQTPLRADSVPPKTIKLDGIPKEWPAGLDPAPHVLEGRSGKPDLSARVAIAYDDTSLYVAADVVDDRLRGGGGDRVVVTIAFPDGPTAELSLFPGQPGKSPGAAKRAGGEPIAGAKVVEAPAADGWTLEASVPWAAMPAAKTVRVGLRGAVFVHDADASAAVESIVGTAPSAAAAALPPLWLQAEQALADGLLKDKTLKLVPKHDIVANVAGDEAKERVLVVGRYLAVLGPRFRQGVEYFWKDLEADPAQGMLPSFEVRDLTGDGAGELVLRRRYGTPAKWREMIEVLSFGAAEVPSPIFRHEVGLSGQGGSIENVVSFSKDGAKTSIVIEPGTAKGYGPGSYGEPVETRFDPLLLPWGGIASQTYEYQGGAFVKAAEARQEPAAPPEPAPSPKAAAAAPPAGPPPAELAAKVYEQYKRDRGASGKPRFDTAADVAGDGRLERVLLHDRDVVVLGPGFKGGTAYAFLTLSSFASGSDIREISAWDLTGDGKAELVVKGTTHATASPEAGGGTVDREVLLVYRAAGESLERVFAAETARAVGKKKVTAAVRFVGAGKTTDIELAAGSATEWTQATYPFAEDTKPVSGFEPLILPWGSIKSARYKWNGSGFSR